MYAAVEEATTSWLPPPPGGLIGRSQTHRGIKGFPHVSEQVQEVLCIAIKACGSPSMVRRPQQGLDQRPANLRESTGCSGGNEGSPWNSRSRVANQTRASPAYPVQSCCKRLCVPETQQPVTETPNQYHVPVMHSTDKSNVNIFFPVFKKASLPHHKQQVSAECRDQHWQS
jgi:hypothetical protein